MVSRTVSSAVFLLSLLVLSAVSNVYATTCIQPGLPHPTPIVPFKCPIDTLKLGTCTDLLGLVKVVIGTPPKSPCCTVLQDLAGLEVALCLCKAIKADILGIHVNVHVALSAIISACHKTIPPGFQCP